MVLNTRKRSRRIIKSDERMEVETYTYVDANLLGAWDNDMTDSSMGDYLYTSLLFTCAVTILPPSNSRYTTR